MASLIRDDATLQFGVGGAIGCLGQTPRSAGRYRIVTGAISASVRDLEASGKLLGSTDILGSALVGDDEHIDWASTNRRLRILSSDRMHNSRWLGQIPSFWSVNIGILVDFNGNINSEFAGARLVSGRGGAPNFAAGAPRSAGGGAVMIVRADKPNCLVEHIARPTISGSIVDFVVTENGVADLRGTQPQERRARLEKVFG